MADETVRVTGLAELQRALRKVDDSLKSALKSEFLSIASEVVGLVQGKMPHRSGSAAASVKPKATNRGAGISFGGSKAPYEPWLDFGGTVGRGHVAGQGGGAIGRPIIPGGRYVYPAMEQHKIKTEQQVEELVIRMAHRAGFEAN